MTRCAVCMCVCACVCVSGVNGYMETQVRSDRQTHTYTLSGMHRMYATPLYSSAAPYVTPLPRRRPGWSRRRRRAMLRGVSTKHWRRRWSFASPNSMRNWPTATLIRSRDSTRTTRCTSLMFYDAQCERSSILTCYYSFSLLEYTVVSNSLSGSNLCYTSTLNPPPTRF